MPTPSERNGHFALHPPKGKKRILATTYSHAAFRRTTIGATAFHFRVRDGNGWFHCAVITRVRALIGILRGLIEGSSNRDLC